MQRSDNLENPSVSFRFRNLGPITDAELKLGNLTVIAGRNNTGKTYLAYTLYGFLKLWKGWPNADDYFLDRKSTPHSARLIGETIAGGFATRQVDRDTLSKERELVLARLAGEFSDGAIATVFSSPQDAWKKARVDVEVGNGFSDVRNLEIHLRGDKAYTIDYDGSEIKMGCSDPKEDGLDEYWLSILYLRFLLHDLFADPFVLSAERFGISLFYKELDFTKNRLVDLLQKMGDDRDRDAMSPFELIESTTSRYALPIKDNIDYTRDISNVQKEKSEIFEEKLFNNIKDMMGGYYRSTNNEIRFISQARKEGSFSIPLHRSSSSARGLSDFYFFLRHVAKENHLLIIDEPESHLDTSNQIQLARLLARVVGAGVKVLVTTHSDYLIKEINNLIMLSGSFEGKSRLAKKLKYKKNDLLPAELVRAYVAENNSLTPCTIDEFGIDMPFFDSTISEINRVSNELATHLARDGVE